LVRRLLKEKKKNKEKQSRRGIETRKKIQAMEKQRKSECKMEFSFLP